MRAKGTSWDGTSRKSSPTLEEVENPASESRTESENAGSEAKNYFATEMEESDHEIKDSYYPLYM